MLSVEPIPVTQWLIAVGSLVSAVGALPYRSAEVPEGRHRHAPDRRISGDRGMARTRWSLGTAGVSPLTVLQTTRPRKYPRVVLNDATRLEAS
jgi:hypothetical protein